MGIANESGELMEIVKKDCFYTDYAADIPHIMEELGDLLFFIQMIAGGLNATLQDLIKENMRKLNRRYKDGFTKEEAVNRADKKLRPGEVVPCDKHGNRTDEYMNSIGDRNVQG